MSEQIEKKEIFYQKIKPYVDESLVGIYGTETILKKIVAAERYIYPLLKEALSDVKKHRGSLYFFREDKLESFQKWVAENRAKGITVMDPKLEEELRNRKGQI